MNEFFSQRDEKTNKPFDNGIRSRLGSSTVSSRSISVGPGLERPSKYSRV